MLPVQDFWQSCLDVLSTKLSPRIFTTWFEPIQPLSLARDHDKLSLRLQVPSRFCYEWLERRYSKVLGDAVDQIGGPGTEISFHVDAAGMLDEQEPSTIEEASSSEVAAPFVRVPHRAGELMATGSAPSFGSGPQFRRHEHQLNASYTFETFIEGDCNRLARSAAQAVADHPAETSFNPFLIYGGVGLGKTHLTQAIGNHAVARNWPGRCLYVSSERFTAQFVHAIQENRIADFTRYYRNIDILIVDDVQFFGGKEKTQEEFFHIFNELHQSGRQIILSADRPPREIDGIEERLLSRFQWGLTADVQPPDLETRIAILRRKAQANSLELSDEVYEFIAQRIKTNVRKLEGALVRLAAHAALQRGAIEVDEAAEVLRDLVDQRPEALDIEHIKRVVAEYYHTDVDLFSAKTRRREIVQARQVAMYCCKQFTKQALKTIGLRFGGRDHSTVIHACRSVENRIDTEPSFRHELDRIQSELLTRRSAV